MEGFRFYKKIIIIIAIHALISTNVHGQEITSDSILDLYIKQKSKLERVLRYYRISEKYLPRECYDYYPKGTKRFYKGVDLSANGMVTKEMRKRIIQLLNDEFYVGEVDSTIDYIQLHYSELGLSIKDRDYWNKMGRDFVTQTMHEKYHFDIEDLIRFCGVMQDDEIKNLLTNAYETNRYENVQHIHITPINDFILQTLARMGAEPYLSMYIAQNKYNAADDSETMIRKIDNLEYIPRKEAFIEIVNFLFTDKYREIITECDNSIITDTDQEASIEYVNSIIVPDTLEEEIEIVINPFVVESIDSDLYSHSNNEYVNSNAIMAISHSIRNDELLSIIREVMNPYTSEDVHKKLTKAKCKQIKKWMKKNYNNYNFLNRW